MIHEVVGAHAGGSWAERDHVPGIGVFRFVLAALTMTKMTRELDPCPRWPDCGCRSRSGRHACERHPLNGFGGLSIKRIRAIIASVPDPTETPTYEVTGFTQAGGKVKGKFVTLEAARDFAKTLPVSSTSRLKTVPLKAFRSEQ